MILKSGTALFALIFCTLWTVKLLAADVVQFNQHKAIDTSDAAFSMINNLSSAYEFKQKNSVRLPNGKVRYKLLQYYNSIPVWNTNIVSHKENVEDILPGDYVSGSFLSNLEKDISSVRPGLSKIQAVGYAKKSIGITDIRKMQNTNVELIIRMFDKTAKLVYVIDFFLDGPNPSRPHFLVDANTGEVLKSWEGLTTSNYLFYKYNSHAISNIYREVNMVRV